MAHLTSPEIVDLGAYFCVVAESEISRRYIGTLARPVEDDANVFTTSTSFDAPEVDSLDVLIATPGGDVANVGMATTVDLTPLGHACKQVSAVLVQVVPRAVSEHVRLIVDWFALNPPQHRGHGHTEAAREPYLLELGLTEKQAMAFAKFLWGMRYREPETSLLGLFLKQPDADTDLSGTHLAAFMTLQREINSSQPTVRRRTIA